MNLFIWAPKYSIGSSILNLNYVINTATEQLLLLMEETVKTPDFDALVFLKSKVVYDETSIINLLSSPRPLRCHFFHLRILIFLQSVDFHL